MMKMDCRGTCGGWCQSDRELAMARFDSHEEHDYCVMVGWWCGITVQCKGMCVMGFRGSMWLVDDSFKRAEQEGGLNREQGWESRSASHRLASDCSLLCLDFLPLAAHDRHQQPEQLL